ncbi:hypothetical protein LIER_22944 [Lithospermum erythrorhizon]|uniref:Uncharacterized protein n=1 Tax=Lithospermum erythrorhizon TaxID=34254 RepID=A0AAV3QZ31_LITER
MRDPGDRIDGALRGPREEMRFLARDVPASHTRLLMNGPEAAPVTCLPWPAAGPARSPAPRHAGRGPIHYRPGPVKQRPPLEGGRNKDDKANREREELRDKNEITSS